MLNLPACTGEVLRAVKAALGRIYDGFHDRTCSAYWLYETENEALVHLGAVKDALSDWEAAWESHCNCCWEGRLAGGALEAYVRVRRHKLRRRWAVLVFIGPPENPLDSDEAGG